jgi:hypothetical protein
MLGSLHAKVVSLSALPTGYLYTLVPISVRSCVHFRAMVRAERLNQDKIPMTPSGIAVAQCLKQLHHSVLTFTENNHISLV